MGARLPGQYAAPYLARAPNMGVRMSGQYAAPNPVSFSNMGAGGPVQRLAPGQAQSTAGRRHIPDYPIRLAPVQRIAHQSQGPQKPARSATLTYGIADNKTTAPQVPSHDNRSKSSLQEFAGQISAAATEQPPILFTPDPVPSEYFHKANIRVADRLAKGNGVAYLLEKSPTDTGTFSVFLEGLKYLEYPILDMVNYIANSQELCPQFKEADGESRECAASKAAAPKKDVCTPATSKTALTTHASAGAALEASLVGLSLSPQVLPPRRITSSGSVSSYAMDLGTLDFAVKDCDNEQSQSAQVDETDDLARDLQQILPTFEKVSQALVSISESKRELAAKRVLQNLKGASGADELLRTLLLLSAKSGAEASLETVPSCCGPKYSRKKLLHLRSSACIPPKWVFHTGFLPVRPQRNAETTIKATGESGQPQKTKENETVTNVNAGTQMDREQDSMSMTSILTALVDIMKTPVSMLDNCENPTAVPEVSQVVPSTPVKQKNTVGTDRGNSVTKGLNSSRWA
ncbi:hypothetical protein CMQ_941 [Grosmannia clavigera kw1407]|uniref:Uncharacterized protein n=1 Tax=Grosmannia clavigera (strain kw1407 / UAMH 11150) TaxID=655863 RepID=F0XDV4_GROCL|nr:uncharacterized protein CMQ_941 [Grosmannia clavigera kw1407]EFX04013.1 hypothetical protein CMQ_941 [Grosmannia clavigera kw1407]